MTNNTQQKISELIKQVKDLAVMSVEDWAKTDRERLTYTNMLMDLLDAINTGLQELEDKSPVV